jgi:hypothetical protein
LERSRRGLEHHIGGWIGDSEMHNSYEGVCCLLVLENAARIFVYEEEFILEQCEALAKAANGFVVRGEMSCSESRRHPQ